MRTYKNLYPQVYDFQNLYEAYLKARRGHRYQPEVLIFTNNLESELIQLQNELIWKTYKTGSYRRFYVNDPKTRLVAALPFRDRVLQHALCNIIEPLFERKFIYDSYACRKGKGTHAGADRVTEFLRRATRLWPKPYCLKCDISQYFPSVRHNTLLAIIRRTIACEDTLWLIQEILSSWVDTNDPDPRGLPIGNLTSQLWANVYLDQLDHFIKEVLRVKFYVRYMDDFVIIGGNKAELWQIKREVETFLDDKLGLHLNGKTGIFPISHGVDFLGYRIWPDHRLLRKRSTKRIKRALRHFQKLYSQGKIGFDRINATVQSWLGHAKHADSYHFRQKLFDAFPFVKGGGECDEDQGILE
ncbi:MAG: RNA-directed polymerase [Thermacetogenium sp.]|nr:RNA-directed polymerase [Thermacetogenium sp.]